MKLQGVISRLAVIGAITLLGASAFAMGPSDCPNNPGRHQGGCMENHAACMQGHEGHKGMMREAHNMLPWMLKNKLGLTGKQTGEISDIMAEEHQKGKPLFDAMKKERKALMDVATAKSGDKSSIKAQSDKLADAFAAIAVHRSNAHKRIAAVMTKEQADKFEQLIAEFGKHEGHPHEGMGACGMGHEKCPMHKGADK